MRIEEEAKAKAKKELARLARIDESAIIIEEDLVDNIFKVEIQAKGIGKWVYVQKFNKLIVELSREHYSFTSKYVVTEDSYLFACSKKPRKRLTGEEEA